MISYSLLRHRGAVLHEGLGAIRAGSETEKEVCTSIQHHANMEFWIWTPIPDGMTVGDLGRRFFAARVEVRQMPPERKP